MSDRETPARFKILQQPRLAMVGISVKDVPWALVEPLRERAMRAHNQTLERLDERGGLSPYELYCHVHGLKFNATIYPPDAVLLWFREWVKDGSKKERENDPTPQR